MLFTATTKKGFMKASRWKLWPIKVYS